MTATQAQDPIVECVIWNLDQFSELALKWLGTVELWWVEPRVTFQNRTNACMEQPVDGSALNASSLAEKLGDWQECRLYGRGANGATLTQVRGIRHAVRPADCRVVKASRAMPEQSWFELQMQTIDSGEAKRRLGLADGSVATGLEKVPLLAQHDAGLLWLRATNCTVWKGV